MPVWEEALRAYARLQIASVSRLDELLALGCLDLRLERLAQQVDALFAELPWLLQGSPDHLALDLSNESVAVSPSKPGTPGLGGFAQQSLWPSSANSRPSMSSPFRSSKSTKR